MMTATQRIKTKTGKLQFDNLVLEVTRRCNMKCAHCLRGDAQNADIWDQIIDALLRQTSYINAITFSGGEPTLRLNAIRHTLERCQQWNIPVMSFYIVTNGKQVSMEFLKLCLEWYAYCVECGGEPDMCGVALSQDKFHSKVSEMNKSLLSGLSFFRDSDKETDWNKTPLIAEGNAEYLDSSKYKFRSNYEENPNFEWFSDNELMVNDASIYVNVWGDVIKGCDFSYDTQDSGEYTYGNVMTDDLFAIFAEMAEEEG